MGHGQNQLRIIFDDHKQDTIVFNVNAMMNFVVYLFKITDSYGPLSPLSIFQLNSLPVLANEYSLTWLVLSTIIDPILVQRVSTEGGEDVEC